MIKSPIIEYFSDLTEPREDNKRHKLIDIVFITICASISGAEKWEDIEAFGESKVLWLRKYLELPNGIPSHDTIARLFAELNPEEFNKAFLKWITTIKPKIEEEIINIDGKTLRASYDSTNAKSAIHMVSAWANKAGITLGQLKTNEKSNEITAIPELIDLLEIEGCIITIDAMGTQKKIVDKIIEKKANYVLALKGNQGTLKDDIELYFQDAQENNFSTAKFDYHKSVEKDHGRIEIRECRITDDLAWLSQKNDWHGLVSICMINATRIIGEKQTSETRFYISSLAPDAEKHNNIIRKHWGIENSLHWVLDMAYDEDQCRKRKNNSPENFAIVRHISLNLLKKEKTCKRSIAGKRLKAAWDTDYLEQILF